MQIASTGPFVLQYVFTYTHIRIRKDYNFSYLLLFNFSNGKLIWVSRRGMCVCVYTYSFTWSLYCQSLVIYRYLFLPFIYILYLNLPLSLSSHCFISVNHAIKYFLHNIKTYIRTYVGLRLGCSWFLIALSWQIMNKQSHRIITLINRV